MRKEKSPSTPAAKSTKLTSGTDKSCLTKSCLTLSTDSITKSDGIDNLCNPDNTVGSSSAANTDNAVNTVNSTTPSTLFSDEHTTIPQPKQQRIGSKQRRLEFGDYKANYLAPVKIENRHSLNISNAKWRSMCARER